MKSFDIIARLLPARAQLANPCGARQFSRRVARGASQPPPDGLPPGGAVEPIRKPTTKDTKGTKEKKDSPQPLVSLVSLVVSDFEPIRKLTPKDTKGTKEKKDSPQPLVSFVSFVVSAYCMAGPVVLQFWGAHRSPGDPP